MKNKPRTLIILSFLILSVLIVTYFIYLSSYLQPRIDFEAQITKINSVDYQKILDSEQVTLLQDKGKEKFAHISVDIKVTNPLGLSLTKSVKIERDLLHEYLVKDERIQILSGGGYEHGNGMEYGDDIEIYLKDISEEQLRTMLKGFKVKVAWKSIWQVHSDKIFYLGDYL